ncbi:MAG: SH3 domain-containing protein, partial [Chloroflexia bacterium]|nr:SH3 domain-containing protein [Chloroflexia bacterium]
RLRRSPGYEHGIISAVPEGTKVDVLGESVRADDGTRWYEVAAGGETGYMVSDYLAASSALLTATSGDATTIDRLHLRTGPSLGDESITVLPDGATVALTGENRNGWLSLAFDGREGYAYGAFLTQGAEVDEPAEPAAPRARNGTRWMLDAVNLREGAGLDERVLRVLGAGTTVELSGPFTNGFARVTAGDGAVGWVATEFLGDSPSAAPAPPSAAIVWPVRGGEWEISQGYNGSSHVNVDGLWQYQYSFDLARTDGGTAGQAVYSPVDGTVRWYDPSTGGVSIDMGDGLAFAMFHAEYDAGIAEGEAVSQGQYLGTISGPGGGGNGGFPHLHITVWETNDGGNWSRMAVPFTGRTAISGVEFPNSGAGNDHRGFVFTP